MKKAITLKDEDGNVIYPCPYYPVGAIYMSVNDHNPGDIFGGEWEQIQDVFLLGCGSLYENGSKGGEATHKLTINEMPSHNHGAVSTSGSKNTSIALYPFSMIQQNYNLIDTWQDKKQVCSQYLIFGYFRHKNMCEAGLHKVKRNVVAR